MEILNLHIKNFKSLKDIKIERLENLNIFIGKNNSGKSNILKAIELFFDELWYLSENGSPSIKGINRNLWFNMDTTNPIELYLTIKLNESESRELEDSSKDGRPTKIRFSMKVFEIEPDTKNMTYSVDYSVLEFVSKYPYLSNKNEERNKIINLIKNKFYFIPADRGLTDETYTGIEESAFNGKKIKNSLAILKNSLDIIERKKFFRIQEIIKEIGSDFGVLDSSLDRNNVDVNFENNDLLFPSSSVGSGLHDILIIVSNLVFGGSGVIFAVEEPEIHLHPEATRKLFNFLKKESESTQIFLTTHSSIFVDKAILKNIFLVKKYESKTNLIQTESNLNEIKSDLGIRFSDALINYNFCILVEGSSDKIFLEGVAKKMGKDLLESKILVDPIHNDNFEPYLKILKHFKIPFTILTDSNNKQKYDDLKREDIISQEEVNVLSKGELENYYPKDIIIQVLKKLYPKLDIAESDLKDAGKMWNNIHHVLYSKGCGSLNKETFTYEIINSITIEDISNDFKTIIEKAINSSP